MSNVVFTTKRLRFRTWTEEDRIALQGLNASSQVMEHFPDVLSTEESDKLYDRVQAYIKERGYGAWAVDRIDQDHPEFIGLIGFNSPNFALHGETDWTEILWRTKPSSWGAGLATEGAKAALDYAFDYLGLSTIYSMTIPNNVRSERVMQKIGMSHIGFFDHPQLPADSPLLKHTLYKIDK